ncbi:Metallo-hydrolase/oxidoreductase [Testicularia cyperi]|uniref:Metallo-hydrolase/oxidoreductase n=1 Tax=Testicularia cyperi TaxID=1882483 RepID=A0A317XV50_9BASI|nr:Metallo-hydrolase/oxidoreductase [Testicularia cyperi]
MNGKADGHANGNAKPQTNEQNGADVQKHHHGKQDETTGIAYAIQLSVRITDPIAAIQEMDDKQLPDHWGKTLLPASKQSKTEVLLPRLTFENPWPSFRKPGPKDLLGGGLKWGLPDSYTEGGGKKPYHSGIKSQRKIQRQMEEAQKAGLGQGWDHVEVQTPDWGWRTGLLNEVDELRKENQGAPAVDVSNTYSKDKKAICEWKDSGSSDVDAARVTWLGHATTLLQLPPLSPDAGHADHPEANPADTMAPREAVCHRSINILFDPVFSERCSPSQAAGPQRFTPAPCKVEDLPPIDVVCISHSHYDHLDYLTMKHLRKIRGNKIHAFVGLGVKDKLVSFGWKAHQITEMDWWDSATLQSLDPSTSSSTARLKIICTPAQHGSGRGAGDKDASLWASWVVEWYGASDSTSDRSDGGKGDAIFRAFFSGDTGLKYHHDNPNKRHKYKPCPAFAEIAARLGRPDLLLLPISVGSSLSYFRSWDPFPRAMSPFPRVSAALTSSIHMDPYDAVEMHHLMLENGKPPSDSRPEHAHGQQRKPVSLAVHYGTFVRNENQTSADIRELRQACEKWKLPFKRTKDGRFQVDKNEEKGSFLVSHQGETVWIPFTWTRTP